MNINECEDALILGTQVKKPGISHRGLHEMEIESSLTSVVNGGLSPSPSPCPIMDEKNSNYEQEERSSITAKCNQKIVSAVSNAYVYEDMQLKILQVCDSL